MKHEERIIKASLFAGATDIIIGLAMHVSNLHEWYFENFHLFGVLGIGMISYGFWHRYFYRKEVKNVQK